MRQYSDIEKSILQAICKGNTQMANLVCLFLDNETVRISKADGISPMSLFIDLKKFQDDALTNRAYNITEKIVIIVNLLKYLEEHSLITYFLPSHGRVFSGNYTRTQELYDYWQSHKTEFTEWSFTDDRTQKYILENTDYVILPTEELKIHLKNEYRTHEEMRHSQQMWATWIAIGVSLLLGLYGVYQNTSDKTQVIKLEQNQKGEIIEAIRSFKGNKKDTLKLDREQKRKCCAGHH